MQKRERRRNPLNASQSTVCGLGWKRYSRQTPLRDVTPALNGRASLAGARPCRTAGARFTAAKFVEVESGKHSDRQQLAAALAACKKHKARLVIAKLDRLSRNLAFIAALMESGVEFVAVDNPHANKLTVHILAAVAEHEREMISERTKAALQAAKARGVRLGNPQLAKAAKRGVAAAAAMSFS
jgi:DNA invertase Pin-like site-specific DNA recombinase